MSDLNTIGERDSWRCWLCDEAVNPELSVNADRGPSVDGFAAAKGKKGAVGIERLAHRSCNTKKGKIAPVVPWASDLLVIDPSPIIATVDRLSRKGGREVIARCPRHSDTQAASEWLLDRLSRLVPDLPVATSIEEGGGQYLLILRTD